MYVRLVVKRVGHIISGSRAGYAYLAHTIPRFYGAGELANIILDTLGKRNLNTSDMQLYQIILLYIHFKASNSFLSVTVLCDRGLVGDAKSCCRKLIEMMINMMYMMDDKDTRQNQYFHHLPFAMSKDLRSRQDTPTDLSEAVPDQIRRMQKDVVQW